MSHSAETEIKLEVRDLRAVRRRIRELGFWKAQSRHLESNTLYDFDDLRLWKARSLLRLRREGGKWLVTFKGAPLESGDYKVRREIETRVEDGEQLEAIWKALGLRVAFVYEKYRTVYAEEPAARSARGAWLFLDETPIGNYLELEGPKRWIDRVAAKLGYRHEDYITASYASLYREKCRARGERPAHMVFTPRKT
jgi:adenylate cyclase class 2